MIRKIADLFGQEGYRYCKAKPEEVGIFYKFYPEGFQVCLLVDYHSGFELTPAAFAKIEEKVLNLFYHPLGKLEGFPEGIPIYHVEMRTILVGEQKDAMHVLCANCKNIWAILPSEKKLLIYENQPGECFGLRRKLEDILYGITQYSEQEAQKMEQTYQQQYGTQQKSRKQIDWKNLPYLTIGIAAINIVVFMLMEWVGNTTDGAFVAAYGGLFPPYVMERGEWWRLFTSMFIHFGAAHLLNNMVIFACVGSRFEKAIGHVKYLLIYLLSGLGSSALSLYMMLKNNDYAVSAGASGAIFGMMGGMLWVVLRHKGRYKGMTGKGMFVMIALCLYYGFATAGVDNWGHIGGMVAGFILTALFYRRKSQKD